MLNYSGKLPIASELKLAIRIIDSTVVCYLLYEVACSVCINSFNKVCSSHDLYNVSQINDILL